jgi:hypothetical protein
MAPKRGTGIDNRFRLTEDEVKLILTRRETGVIPDQDIIHSDRHALKLSAKHHKLLARYKSALDELDSAYSSLDVILAVKENIHKPILKLTYPKKKSGKSRSVVVTPLSDVHLGERVDPDTVNGLNKYNVAIATKRLAAFFEKIIYLTNLMRHETQIDTWILPLLGDLISGDIHEELREENELSASQAIFAIEEMIIDGIDYVRKHGQFKKIVIPCCFGNHARTTKKKRHGSAWKTSYEYLLYRHLAKVYNDDRGITFQLSKGYHNYVEVWKNFKVRLHHGDKISYKGGVGGISIPVNKAVQKWSNIKRVKLDIFAHFHQSKEDGLWISNGSVIGFNPYAISIKADYETPRQRFIVIEEEKGLTFNLPILL